MLGNYNKEAAALRFKGWGACHHSHPHFWDPLPAFCNKQIQCPYWNRLQTLPWSFPSGSLFPAHLADPKIRYACMITHLLASSNPWAELRISSERCWCDFKTKICFSESDQDQFWAYPKEWGQYSHINENWELGLWKCAGIEEISRQNEEKLPQ